MKDLIEKVLNKYNVKHHDLSTRTLAELIVAHMTVGVDVKKYEDFSIR